MPLGAGHPVTRDTCAKAMWSFYLSPVTPFTKIGIGEAGKRRWGEGESRWTEPHHQPPTDTPCATQVPWPPSRLSSVLSVAASNRKLRESPGTFNSGETSYNVHRALTVIVPARRRQNSLWSSVWVCGQTNTWPLSPRDNRARGGVFLESRTHLLLHLERLELLR